MDRRGRSIMELIVEDLTEETPPPPVVAAPGVTASTPSIIQEKNNVIESTASLVALGPDNVFATNEPDVFKESIPEAGTPAPPQGNDNATYETASLPSIASSIIKHPSLTPYTSVTKSEHELVSAVVSIVEKENFGNKLEYILVLISYAIGFGTLWRFPYLMLEYGGIVFLIPYTVMLLLVGIPMFLLELAIGQRLRKSSFKAWTEISPYLTGIGIACALSCVLIGFYLNTLIAWCCYYVISVFNNPLKWTSCKDAEAECQKDPSGKRCKKCQIAGASSYFWYNNILDISDGIEDSGELNLPLLAALIFSWVLLWAILVKGMKVAGKVAYMTSFLPYVVLLIFLGFGFTLDGMKMGYDVVMTPDWSKLWNVKVWFIAGTQIMFTQGIAVGILVSYAALQPPNNNCVKDAFTIPLIDYFTSLLGALVNSPILGSKGWEAFKYCNETVWTETNVTVTVSNSTHVLGNNGSHVNVLCDFRKFVKESANGTGLIFITFTQAVKGFPKPQIFAFLFFFMLLTVGVGSSFPSLEGFVLCVQDMNIKHVSHIAKWKLTTITCTILMLFGLIFGWGWGNYMLTFIDQFTANWSLLVISFFECVAVAWVYGLRRFARDIYLMAGYSPKSYMMIFFLICIKFISPFIMFIIFIFTLAQYGFDESSLEYLVWDRSEGKTVSKRWPTYVIVIGFILTFLIVGSIFVFAILAYFGIHPLEIEPPSNFPERKLKRERNLTIGEYENLPQSKLEKILYWKLKKCRKNKPKQKEAKAEDGTAFNGSGTIMELT